MNVPRIDVVETTAARLTWPWSRASRGEARKWCLERDTERGYSINVKQVTLAFAVEFFIIGLILVGQYLVAEEAAKELGVELLWDGPTDLDPAKQNEVVEAWITRGVEAICVSVENEVAISTVLRKARDRRNVFCSWTPASLTAPGSRSKPCWRSTNSTRHSRKRTPQVCRRPSLKT